MEATPVNIRRLAESGAKVCFLNSNRAWGGGENWHLTAARFLSSRNCQVILCGRPDGALYEAGRRELADNPAQGAYLQVAEHYFSNLDFLNPLKTRRFRNFLRANGVTHIIAGQTNDMKGALVSAGSLDTKVFYRRGLAFPVKNTWINRWAYKALNGFITNSRATAELVLENVETLNRDKVRVIYNAVDIEKFDSQMARHPAQNAAWSGPEAGRPFVIGNAGRLTLQKGQKYLLHMAAELKRRGIHQQTVIAGDGELLDELLALADKLGLSAGRELGSSSEVVFTGFMADMAPFWQAIDFFALSSLWEGFGYVLAEAMLARKGLCAFDANSMPEVVSNGENGFLLPLPQAVESDEAVGARLADLITRCMAEPELLRKMGERGREICEVRFDERIVMDELAQTLLN